MQPVSRTFDAYPADRLVDAEITFKLVDVGAARNATPSVTSAEPLSKPAQLVQEDNLPTGKRTTMEPGMWLLDGTWEILPDNLSEESLGLWTVPVGLG